VNIKVPVTAFTFSCNKIHNKRSSEKNLKKEYVMAIFNYTTYIVGNGSM